jgi:hypothetical protein
MGKKKKTEREKRSMIVGTVQRTITSWLLHVRSTYFLCLKNKCTYISLLELFF